MNKPLKVVVVGAGPMGSHHAEAITRLPELAVLAAVVDADSRRAQEVAAARGVSAFDDLATCLREVVPDVVHVCVPPAYHFDLGLRAIQAGASIYVEKPFTPSVSEADKLLTEAAARGVHVCAGHQLLQDPTTLEGLRLLKDIGDVRHVESYFAFRQRTEPDGSRPRTATEQLLDILPHPTYLLERFMGGGGGATPMAIDGLRVAATGEARLLVSREGVTGTLVATLSGRPVDSYVRVVGTRGTFTMDHVRSVVIPVMGQGSTPEKVIAPYAVATRMVTGATLSLSRRFISRRRSYPGLVENFSAFYRQIAQGAEPPVSVANILETVRICEAVETALHASEPPAAEAEAPSGIEADRPRVLVTGGSGFLGREVVAGLLERGCTPVVMTRRRPPASQRLEGAEYLVGDLAGEFDLPSGLTAVVHCAAETAGGWDAHQRNSLDATENLVSAMERAGVDQLVYVSSVAVIDSKAPSPLSEESALESAPRSRGPYVWGKTEAEQAVARAAEAGRVQVRVFRPGPLIDWRDPSVPGRLGKAIGNTLVAMGPSRGVIPTCDVAYAGELLAEMALDFEGAPPVLNGLDPEPVTRREVVRRLREHNSQLRVFWFPRPPLVALSGVLVAVQKLLRPSKPAINVARVFAAQPFDVSRTRDFARDRGLGGRNGAGLG